MAGSSAGLVNSPQCSFLDSPFPTGNTGKVSFLAHPEAFPIPNGIDPARNGIDPARNGMDPARNGIEPAPNGMDPAGNGIDPGGRGIGPIRPEIVPKPRGGGAAGSHPRRAKLSFAPIGIRRLSLGSSAMIGWLERGLGTRRKGERIGKLL